MRTWYEAIKDKIINENYHIRKVCYDNGINIYEVLHKDSETTRTHYCDIAYNIFMMLKKELNIDLEIQENVCALNYTPASVAPDHIEYFVRNPVETLI